MNDAIFNAQKRVLNDFAIPAIDDDMIQEGDLSSLAASLDRQGVATTVNDDANVYDFLWEIGRGHRVVAAIDPTWFSKEGLRNVMDQIFGYQRPDFAMMLAELDIENPDMPGVRLTDAASGNSVSEPMESFMKSVGDARCPILATEEPTLKAAEGFAENGWTDNHVPSIGGVDFNVMDYIYGMTPDGFTDWSKLHGDGKGGFDIEIWLHQRGFEFGDPEGLKALAMFAEPTEVVPEMPDDWKTYEMLRNLPSPEQIALRASNPDLFDDDSTPISPEATMDLADRQADMLQRAHDAELNGYHSTASALRHQADELGDLIDSGHWD